jgi:glycosyl hydrolase family 79
LLVTATSHGPSAGEEIISPTRMKAISTVDARFQSYNIEMVEITGGRFWRPYPRSKRASTQIARDRYSYRAPVDLSNPRLRMLAGALGPVYLRVSGTWANATFFADADDASAAPPRGFDSVLSRVQWRGVVDFARALNAEIVTSFAVSGGNRNADGNWSPDQAQHLLSFTQSLGSRIAAVEFMNEPTLAATNGVPPGYDAKAYGRDFAIFRAWMREHAPNTLIVGPGSIGDSPSLSAEGIRARDLLAASGPGLDRFSYHHYNTQSPRCGGRDDPEQALSADRLSRTDRTRSIYSGLRDEFEPGKPIWLTETADAACGGNRWDATFLDTFRYLDQLGRLAKAGVAVVMHNTLAASDYGLLDETTFRPRPNYWGALLWHRLMGATVLDAGAARTPDLYVYAHCHPAMAGTISVLAINTSRSESCSLKLPIASKGYTLHATQLQSPTVQLNGKTLELDANDGLPLLEARMATAGAIPLKPATITFLVIPDAANPACR